eukprot:TRINITY_DN8694_c0_g1_i1.p1 TRINITY_DN8694_c0_g1~~TRINITY_DN8694_c0_g1_i1.p1  ORF type:complete len:299 (-),score=31.67 TRINITY_DN8694_c0_g1_i1:135-1031(-)
MLSVRRKNSTQAPPAVALSPPAAIRSPLSPPRIRAKVLSPCFSPPSKAISTPAVTSSTPEDQDQARGRALSGEPTGPKSDAVLVIHLRLLLRHVETAAAQLPNHLPRSLFAPLSLQELLPYCLGGVFGLQVGKSVLAPSAFDDENVSISRFLSRVAQKEPLREETMLYALALLDRCASWQRQDPCTRVPVTLIALPLMFCVACSVATKSLRDQSRTQTIERTALYARASGVSLQRFCRLEFELFVYGLNFNAHVTSESLLDMLWRTIEATAARACIPAGLLSTMIDSYLTGFAACRCA